MLCSGVRRQPLEEPVEGQQHQQRQCTSGSRDEDGARDEKRLVVAAFLRAHGETVGHDMSGGNMLTGAPAGCPEGLSVVAASV